MKAWIEEQEKAFPNEFESSGMNLRDYFAAKALQGLLASDVEASVAEFAIKSYEMADAMMKARKSNDKL